MKNELVKIISIEHATPDVLHIVTQRPKDISFVPGQATEIFLSKDNWENEGRPFTFTGLPNENHLEFYIKTYPSHHGVTNQLLSLKSGEELIVNDVFGAINYKGEGTFIAGGAGVTPFIAILRDLRNKSKLGKNKLIFANKKKSDIILKSEFEEMLQNNFINILSEEETKEYAHGRITSDFIKNNCNSLNSYFYLCGPPPMMDAVEKQLKTLNVSDNLIVKEAF
ncbi:MAG: flavodoxin reductase [Xanthomarina sp.]